MKQHRQLYLGLFLAYCLFIVLLLYPQMIVPHKIPNLFATAGAGFTGTIIAAIIRSRKESVSLSRFIPAMLIILICLTQFAGTFLWVGPTTGHERSIFLFYLITALLNTAASAVGFFLK